MKRQSNGKASPTALIILTTVVVQFVVIEL